MSSRAQKHGGAFIKSNVLWNAKYLARLWDEINFGATKIWRNVLGITRAPERSQNKNDIGSERKPSDITLFKRLFQHCFGFLLFSFSFDDVKFRNPVALFRKKGKIVEIIFHFQKRKIICGFSTFVSESIFNFYQNFLFCEFWEDNLTKNRFS